MADGYRSAGSRGRFWVAIGWLALSVRGCGRGGRRLAAEGCAEAFLTKAARLRWRRIAIPAGLFLGPEIGSAAQLPPGLFEHDLQRELAASESQTCAAVMRIRAPSLRQLQDAIVVAMGALQFLSSRSLQPSRRSACISTSAQPGRSSVAVEWRAATRR